MIGGRLNGKISADLICCTAPNVRPTSACTELAAPTRSANGRIRATMNAAFGS